MPETEQEEWVNETRLVPKEVWEEEPVERLEHRKVTETKYLPHVKAMYPFEGQGMKMEKGEVSLMLEMELDKLSWSILRTFRSCY